MSTFDLDPDALAQIKARFASQRQEIDAARKQGRKPKRGPSKLAQRARREADAFNYGDGRRRSRDAHGATVPLNVQVPPEVKELVQRMARKQGSTMYEIVAQAVYALRDLQDDAQ